jgi:hypothetical protein
VSSVRPALLARTVLLGAATGSRSSFGLSALLLSSDAMHRRGRPIQVAGATGAVAEVVIDKLPGTPSRLQPRGLISRGVAGGACGLLLAARAGEPIDDGALVLAAVGAVAAVGAAFVGSSWRAASARRLCGGRMAGAVVGAIAEDLVAATLAVLAVSRAHV